MNARRIAVITDSGTDTPAKFAAEHDVRVVPLAINYSDGTHYRAGVDITEEEVVERFAEEIPSTSLPSPEDIRAAYEQAKADGYERAVFVGISSGLSSTVRTAEFVASLVEDFPVTVVDTKSIGAAAGLVVMAAAEMIEWGIPYDELGERLEALSRNTHVFFCVDDLTYLRKGGRIDELTYRLGSILHIKPIIWCDAEGMYRTFKKVRGWNRAVAREAKCVAEFAHQHVSTRLAVACTAASECFAEMEHLLREKVPNVAEIVRAGISPALLVHTGPMLVGMAVQPLWQTLE